MAHLALNGRRIGYQVTGEGEPVLAFHGTTQAGNAWDQVIAAQTIPRTWVNLEFPGSGESSMPDGPIELSGIVDDAVTVMDHLGHRSFHVVGYSLGAVTALQFAATHPGRTRTVTSLCGWAVSDARMKATFGLWQKLIAASPELFMHYAIVDGYTLGAIEMIEPIIDQAVALAATTVQPGSAAHLELDGRVDISDAITRITSPCLVLGGVEDRWVDIAHSRHLAAAIAGARLVELPAGHLVIGECAAEIARLLDSHMA